MKVDLKHPKQAKCRVYLNDVLQMRCVEANDETGRVVLYKVPLRGSPPEVEHKYGDVRIEFDD